MTQDLNNEMKSDCPVCGGESTLIVTNKTDNIPYFGNILETAVRCEKCGYQSADNICLDHHDPVRYTLEIGKDKLNTRVAKSQTATVQIPELGLKVEPGAKSQGYVSNVEGILNRFEDAIQRVLLMDNEDPQSVKENALNIMDIIESIKLGEMTTKLIVEDPFGNSIIDDDDVKKEKLTPEEVEKLETGFTIINQDEEPIP